MAEKIFITSAFALATIFVLGKLEFGLPVDRHPKTAYIMGLLSIVTISVFFVSGIWLVWD